MVAVLAFSAAPAIAADLPSPTSPPVFVAPVVPFTWAGPYLGGNVGIGIGASEFAEPVPVDGIGFLGGVGAGYNWLLTPTWLVGFETDLDYRGSIGSTNSMVSQTNDGYLGTVRARFGYAWDRLLVFGTGGFAYGNVIAPKTFSGSGIIYPGFATGARLGNNSTILPGYAVGAGVEYALNNNWSIEAEYLYAHLEHSNPLYTTSVSTGPYPICNISAINVVRIGVNYHFPPDIVPVVPVVAKY
ncbi:MAG: outer membrane protein [Beijerinckiaceae bacterium]